MVTLPPMPAHTRADQAIAILRDVILSGSLAPGTPLRETQLSQELAISRGSLREALQRLEEEGLVQRQAFRGSYVAEVSADTVTQIEQLRTVLEPYAAITALDELRHGEGHQALIDAVEALEKAAQAEDAAQSIDAHLAVHRAIYAATQNQVLLDIWTSWQNQMRLFMALDHRRLGSLTDIATSHRTLLTVIESGDKRAIRREFARHIQPEAVTEDFRTG